MSILTILSLCTLTVNVSNVPYQKSVNHGPIQPPVFVNQVLLEYSQLFSMAAFPLGFPGGSVVKNPPANAADTKDTSSIPGAGRFPWRRKWQPTPVFLPGKSHGQKSLVGYSPWGRKESDTTEQLSTHPCFPTATQSWSL